MHQRSARGRAGLAGDIDGRTAATSALTDEIMRLVRLLKAATDVPGAADRATLLLMLPLMQRGPMRLRELAHAKGVDPSTVSRQVAQLVRAGLVRSEPDPGDGRARRLALTAEGHLRCEQVVQARCHAIGRALQDWSDVQVAAFTDLFREFNGQVEKLAQMTEEPT